MRPHLLALSALCLCSCAAADRLPAVPNGAQAISLLGEPLFPTRASPDVQQRRQEQLAEALAQLERSPGDPDALIWVGRRKAYLGDYRGAIETFSAGIAAFPDDARMYRHRGHRYITLRLFDRAVADFRQAVALTAGKEDEVEPDGQPNPLNIPTSTLQFNIWYHLGLAQYLQADFEGALSSYRECMAVSRNPDSVVATSHWLYMTLRRLGRSEEAARVLTSIHADMEVIENDAYHRLLLMYKGERTPESLAGAEEDAIQSATAGYGVGNWYLYNGDRDRGLEVFRRIVAGDGWAAFGFIAAEAELAVER